MLEFSAIGTAVRQAGVAARKTPFLSDLSGEDFWTLVQAGYRPKGLVMGFSSYFVYRWSDRAYVRLLSNGSGTTVGPVGNVELDNFSQGVYQARALAMQRLQQQGRRLGADGVVGVKVDANKRLIAGDPEPGHLVVDFFVVGTAVAESSQTRPLASPSVALNMKGLRPMRPRLEDAELEE